MSTSYQDGKIVEGSYTYNLPTTDGTIALTSQIPSIPSGTSLDLSFQSGTTSVSVSSMDVGEIKFIQLESSSGAKKTLRLPSSGSYGVYYIQTYNRESSDAFCLCNGYSKSYAGGSQITSGSATNGWLDVSALIIRY